MFKVRLVSKMLLLFIILYLPIVSFAAVPPQQPASGPGGKEYAYASVSKHEYGTGSTRYWIYEPANPKPESAPLIIFNHGWGAINPKAYGAWIEHIVRRGNIVVYPLYQDSLRTSVADFLQNAVVAVKDALGVLQQEGHVRPDLNKCAVVGHSVGGVITPDMAAVAAKKGIPQPKAVMCVEPGKTWAKSGRVAYHFHDLSLIPAGTLLLAIAGDSDRIVKDIDAKRIYNESTQVPQANKNLIMVVSDSHGIPPLKAIHMAPVAQNKGFDSGESVREGNKGTGDQGLRGRIRERLRERMKERMSENSDSEEMSMRIGEAGSTIDALDYYGYWKLFDALCDAAFYGKNREYALGNTPQQRFMGTWSDGVAVKELVVTQE